MILAHSFWCASKHPKFYDGTIRIMEAVNGKAFYRQEDIQHLFALMNERLERDKPAGHQCRLWMTEGMIGLTNGKAHDDAIARISIDSFSKILTYTDDGHDVIEIQNRLER